MGLWNQFT